MRKTNKTNKIKKYNFAGVERKWQKVWNEKGIYTPDVKNAKNPFYNLWMFPYPSAEGLHAGHAFSSTGSDIYGRFMRMHGKDVFQPIGYDSFGIHSENYALKIGEHPADVVKRTIKHYEQQMRMLGHGFDWTRTVTTSNPDYYKWTQWVFTEMFKAGLAYRKKAEVNWCPSCKTVLADEQVIGGKCERCGTEVEIRPLEQWFFRITDYAEKLLRNLKKIDWSERVVTAQRNWIGRKEGVVVKFKVKNSKKEMEVFTTRPDTLYGATFMVVSPESELVKDFVTDKYRESISKYIKEYTLRKKPSQNMEEKEKTGVFTGSYVINPVNGKEIPVWVADYVLVGYGTGAVMGVPAHDQRDWEFAKKYDLSIVEVILGGNVKKEAYDGPGKIINSGDWNGLKAPDSLGKIISSLEKSGIGKKKVNYHLRDWLVSRQRYWGTPIPMIYCEPCAKKGVTFKNKVENKNKKHEGGEWNPAGWFPVPEKDLPLKLPYLKDYKPKGDGSGPLAKYPGFYEVKCPVCGGKARLETDVCDTFVDSSWYFLRYSTVGAEDDDKVPFDKEITRKWLPVDLYFGGAEHSVLHLMYARFISLVLHDLGYLDFDEPFPKFFAHGLMIKDGAKMSKSRGNTVNPDEYIRKYGADTLRLYEMFLGPMDGYPDFRDTGIEGMGRFVERFWSLVMMYSDVVLSSEVEKKEVLSRIHKTIKRVTEDVEIFHYNTAIASIMEFVNFLRERVNSTSVKRGNASPEWKEALNSLVLMLAPFAPHITEELWEHLGNEFSVHTSKWPKYDPKLVIEESVVIAIQINGKLRGTMEVEKNIMENKEKIISLARENKNIVKWLGGKNIKKEIYVLGRLVNFVVE